MERQRQRQRHSTANPRSLTTQQQTTHNKRGKGKKMNNREASEGSKGVYAKSDFVLDW